MDAGTIISKDISTKIQRLIDEVELINKAMTALKGKIDNYKQSLEDNISKTAEEYCIDISNQMKSMLVTLENSSIIQKNAMDALIRLEEKL